MHRDLQHVSHLHFLRPLYHIVFYHDFLIFVDSCQIFRTFFRDLFIIVFPGHLHEAHNGNAEKTASHKTKKKLQHNVFLLNAFHGETNKNDKIRTLA